MIMASKLLIILLSLLTIKSSQAASGEIAVYWGQNNGDGTLTYTCDTGNYQVVVLAFLNVFGCGRPPNWNFAGHCGDWSPCTKLQPEIEHCQRQKNKVKVFLALGGAKGDYSLCSPQDAKDFANYLYNNFLSGQYGPLGSVTLDGITLDIEGDSVSNLYWDDLAKELDALRQPPSKHFYLSAAPQCVIPDKHLDTAIKTGLFDDVFVQFYNNPSCQYSPGGDVSSLLKSWDDWTSLVLQNNTVFMGLPAAPDAAPSGGYIPPNDLINKVLPHIKKTSNYGGVILWDRFHDIQNDNYSDKIKRYVPKDVLQLVTAVSDAIYECVSAALHRVVPKPYY